MSNEHSKQADHATSATYPLVGNEHFTQEERAKFLAEARRQESEYERYLGTLIRNGKAPEYPHEHLPGFDDDEHRYRNPNHPINVKREISFYTWQEQKLTERLNELKSSSYSSSYDYERIERELKKVQGQLNESKAGLEAYYQENPHKRPQEDAANTAGSRQTEATEGVDSKRAWHKQPVDPKQPLQFTESFERAHTNTLLNKKDYEPPEFKPYTGDPRQGMEALYTNVNENTHVRTSHKDINLHPYQQPVPDSHIKHASKYTLLAMGLLGAAEAAKAEPGDLSSKLNAAKDVLKETAVEAVPGVTFLEKMCSGKYQEAGLDAASYLPLGDMTALSRSPEVLAVIDNLPKSTAQLQSMLSDKSEAPINKHLAEFQLRFIEAKEKGELLKGLNALDKLTELAEQKIIYQMQWTKNSSDYAKAVQTPDPDWTAIMKRNPEIAPQIAVHVAAVNSGRPKEFVDQIDANITSALAAGRLLTPMLSREQLNQSAHLVENRAQTQQLEHSH